MFSAPYQTRLFTRRRVLAVAGLSVTALIPFYLRILAGGVMPGMGDQHYSFDLSLWRFFRSFEVYLPRALPSSLALLLVVGLPGIVQWRGLREAVMRPDTKRLALYALLWFMVFLLPVFPIPARSELYLYLPGAGWCLLAGYLVDRLMSVGQPHPRLVASLFVIYAASLLGYQISRNLHAKDVQSLTAAFVQAVGDDEWFRQYRGSVLIVPGDERTERLLREGVSGYIDTVMAYALRSDQIKARVAYSDERDLMEPAEKVFCSFSNGRVLLRRTRPLARYLSRYSLRPRAT
jgi:hypothetical protein